ncbi:hypothetical protein [Herbaspirillum seropedicae]
MLAKLFQQDDELVTAEPPGHIVCANSGLHALADQLVQGGKP